MQTLTRTFVAILMAALAVGLVVFGVQNPQTVKITFLTYTTQEISLSLVVIAAAIAGAALAWLGGLWGAARRGIQRRRDARERSILASRNAELERRLASMEKELSGFRPAAPPPADTKTTGSTRRL